MISLDRKLKLPICNDSVGKQRLSGCAAAWNAGIPRSILLCQILDKMIHLLMFILTFHYSFVFVFYIFIKGVNPSSLLMSRGKLTLPDIY